MSRRSIKLPITLAVVMISLLVALTVGWIVLNIWQASYAMLTIGAVSFLLILVGVVVYLTLSIKAINITRRQSNFIDSVTHELKSPIASLKLYLQTLSRRNVSEAERFEFYKLMLEDVDRLDSLINHVLDAARLERGGAAAEAVDIELDQLLRRCGESVCARYRQPESCLHFDLHPCVVHGNYVDMELIFNNLLDNAFKYGGDPNEVHVQLAELYNGRVVVRISDNGDGIPIRQRQKIFGRFVRLGAELERERPGTGLGLYIVRTLVQRFGGRIRVRGRDKAKGTTFEVTLPGKPSELESDSPIALESA